MRAAACLGGGAAAVRASPAGVKRSARKSSSIGMLSGGALMLVLPCAVAGNERPGSSDAGGSGLSSAPNSCKTSSSTSF